MLALRGRGTDLVVRYRNMASPAGEAPRSLWSGDEVMRCFYYSSLPRFTAFHAQDSFPHKGSHIDVNIKNSPINMHNLGCEIHTIY